MDLPPFLKEVEENLQKKGLAIRQFPWQLIPGTRELYVARFFEWEPIYVEARVETRDYLVFSADKVRHIPVSV